MLRIVSDCDTSGCDTGLVLALIRYVPGHGNARLDLAATIALPAYNGRARTILSLFVSFRIW